MKAKIFLWITLFFSIFIVSTLAVEDPETCADCHDGSEEGAVQVFQEAIDKTAHEGFFCIDCHEDVEELPHEKNLAKVECGFCHEDVSETYKKHGILEIGEHEDVPGCADCHGDHNILPASDKQSQIHPLNLPDTCGGCHEDPELTERHKFLPTHPVETYENSVHGKATSGGIYSAATCNDCHSSNGSAHKIFSPGDMDSTINHFNIPETCGKCHKGIKKDYWEGIHGQLTARGETDSPVCTSCHGEHQILSPRDERSAVSPSQVAEATCAPCHESASLTEKYGLPAGRLASFIDSYHGTKSRAGDTTVANCSSCHGAHLVLPNENPNSSIHESNLQETCGECHEGISKELATTKIHEEGGLHMRGWPYFFTILYYILISVTLIGMILYIILDYFRHTRELTMMEQWRRMARVEVIQHSLLAISFIVLVITGFALRFADSWWAMVLFGREGGFPVRNNLHRVAAVVLVLTSISHIIYIKTDRGKKFIRDVFPSFRDLKDLLQMISYNLGFGKERPSFGRFSYIEKFEYWALVWGTMLMTTTGILLWFDNFFVQFLPKGFLDVMLIIHYYEAWLAALSILIWHLYSTIFNPKVYPMNPSWITGKMPVHQFEHEHPEFAEELKKMEGKE